MRLRSPTPPTRQPAQPFEPLTTREEEVLVPVARGQTNREVADDLHISLSTVKTQLTPRPDLGLGLGVPMVDDRRCPGRSPVTSPIIQ
ncbi:MAG: helix-turn-helix domain-containing protein [Euzebya sp.]